MSALVVLVIALLVARLLGALGAKRLATWPASAAYGLAAMLLLTASAHFVPESVTAMPNHADMVAMVPPFVPFAGAVVYATGVLELAGAVGLVLAATRRAAGISLAVLLVLLLPANIYAAVAEVPFNGGDATPLWLRIPLQAGYIAVALWVARKAGTATAAPRTPEPPRTETARPSG
ncbi:putative membrane protein [Lipingzhangella halophila]|uniref:Putative membrane protein n=1 Tax=Lipingzhangella halophila TaxID=1783352 RepID=A0A7W7RC51_9ACTN|nr:hypothetical protein [Lipingzhangella halophila]MBB4929267.1 putative membrane protein [Lipingzhangella halophila]